jgi:signal transduction histidine kinase
VSFASRVRIGGAAALPIAVGILLSVLVIIGERHEARVSAESAVRADVATTVTQIRTEIRNQLAAAESGAQPASETVPAGELAGSQLSLDAAIQARDSGSTVLDDAGRSPAIIVPVYRDGTAPQTTEQRRADLVAYRRVPLRLDATVERLADRAGGLVVHGPDRIVSAVPGAAPSGASAFGVDMDLSESPGWRVEAWRPDPGTPGVTWFWVVGIMALAVAAGTAGALLVRRESTTDAHRRQLERDRSLVNGLAPVLQASLDLGEVLPSVSSHLREGMGLAGLSLTAPTERGERQLFASGVQPDSSVQPIVRPPDRLEPGATYALSLTRGGRILGVLRVVAGTELLRDDLLALSTAGELVGSTLANAEAFAQQQDLVERMRSVDELKTVFLATASHELRTPVTAIVGFSALLLQHWDTMSVEQRLGLIERVQANSQRLEALTEQLLDFAQLERGLPRSDDGVIDLSRVVGQILGEQPELSAGHEVDTYLTTRCTIRGSRSGLERIVTNLVGNAAKYAPRGTRISVTVQPQGERVLLLVDDEGPGVPDADRERIFSRFYRGSGDSVSRTRGAGVGLAIVAEYAASMSATASVRSAPSGGARFAISFPAVDRAAANRTSDADTQDTAGLEGTADVALP